MLKIRCSSLGKIMTEPKGKKVFTYYKDGVAFSTASFNKLLLSGKPLDGVTSVCEEVKASGLSETCKTYLGELWLEEKYGIYKDVVTHAIMKGLEREEDAITLLAEYREVMMRKNVLRKSNDFITGECDAVDDEIWDTKVSWDITTFFNAEITSDYQWQGQGYCILWNKPAANIAYCLLDTPANLLQQFIDSQIRKLPDFVTQNEIDQMVQEIRLKHVFDYIPNNERLKIFHIERDTEKEEQIYERVRECREYYATLSLSNVKTVEV
jgi:hypothetical protein